MRTLGTFYQSKEWQNLMRIIKAERITEDGELICEHCGNPIVKKYDCIGHHVIHLTEENVNDVMISLNPENVQLVHHACHNKIHNKLGHQERTVFLVYGPPLAGKTTFVKKTMNRGDLVVDIDSIWECISGLDRYEKPPRLNAVAFGVRDTLLDSVRYRRGKWLNAYVIGGYPLEGERERLAKELGAREVFIEVSKQECMDRLIETEDGRDYKSWSQYIDEWFRRYSPPLPVRERSQGN